MKHTIQEKQYRRELDRLDFTIDDRYFCKTYLMKSATSLIYSMKI